ncbi:MAG: patatin-like phospholipase family protein [Acidobacteriota bacterium]
MRASRLAVVLSTGGVGGIAHLGVLGRLQERGIRIPVLVGASAGALVAAYYAALGDPLEALIEDAAGTTPARLAAMALHVRRLPVPGRAAREHCEHLIRRLEALDAVSFDRLRGPVDALGVLAFDWSRLSGFFACTGSAETGTLSVGHVVRGSASVPLLFPPMRVATGARTCALSDGGLVRSLPLEWAFAPPLSATHALGVQLPTLRRHIDSLLPSRRRFLNGHAHRILVVVPNVRLVPDAFRGRSGMQAIYRRGYEALDETILQTLESWQRTPPPASA